MLDILLILLLVSLVFKFFPPKHINWWYGYRTPRSRKNIENWKKANQFAPNFMLVMIVLLLLLHFILPFFDINSKPIISKLLVLGFILLIVFTEKRLQ